MSIHRKSKFRQILVWVLILGLGVGIGYWQAESAQRALSADELQQGYALFYHLMSEESQLDGLLTIKSPVDPLPELVKSIAATAAAVVKEMDKWKAADPTLDFKDPGLPKVEVEARSSISDMRTEQLLFHGGAYFENVLTETQASASNYAWHLAKVLARHETDPTRAKAFAQWRDQWEKLAKATAKVLVFQPEAAAPSAEPGQPEQPRPPAIHHRHR